MSYHIVTKGATNTWLIVTLKDADGDVIDLTDAQTVEVLYDLNGTKKKHAMTVAADPTTGIAEYQWTSAAMTATGFAAGTYDLQFKVTWTSGAIDYFPSRKTSASVREAYDSLIVRAPLE